VVEFNTIATLSNSIYNNFYEVSDKIDGIYYYRVRGYNSEHGWGDFSTLESIDVIIELNPILISNILSTPQIQVPNSWVNITCNITSIGTISEVRTRLTYPNSTFINQTMTNFPSTNIYYINNSYQSEGIYRFDIWVKDTEGNQTKSDFHQFYIGYNATIIPLTMGWNQITIPFENSLYGIASSLGEIITGCTQVSYWNNTQGAYQDWLVDFPDPEDDYAIHQGMGFFVYTDESSTWYGEG
jgi:hypothetical protein